MDNSLEWGSFQCQLADEVLLTPIGQRIVFVFLVSKPECLEFGCHIGPVDQGGVFCYSLSLVTVLRADVREVNSEQRKLPEVRFVVGTCVASGGTGNI